jgi:hypothetical protein
MDPQDEMRQAMRELFDELVKVADQAGKMIRQAAEDASRWVSANAAEHGAGTGETQPLATIRELGRLRDEGLITEAEFQSKKAELLEQL